MNLHAVAIDEHRWPFEAALWRQPPFKKYDTKVEQVWFSGAHSDVGGGYIVEEDRKADTAYADNITLDWMIRRTKHFCSDFPFDTDRSAEEIARQKTAALHNSRRNVYRAWPLAFDQSRTARRERSPGDIRLKCHATGTPGQSTKWSIFPRLNGSSRTIHWSRRRALQGGKSGKVMDWINRPTIRDREAAGEVRSDGAGEAFGPL